MHSWVRTICVDARDRIWFGSWDGGVSVYDGQNFTNYTTQDGLVDGKVQALCADVRGRIWIGTFGGGVSVYDSGAFINYTTEHGLLANCIMGILQDREDQMWFAHLDSGLSCLNDPVFQPMTSASASMVIQDNNGRLWFRDDRHLYCLARGQQHRKSYNHS
jgi:ligand-binding sensor domain-containing protein